MHVKANRKSIIVTRAFLRKHSLCRGLRSRGFLSRMTVWAFLFCCTDLVWQRFWIREWQPPTARWSAKSASGKFRFLEENTRFAKREGGAICRTKSSFWWKRWKKKPGQNSLPNIIPQNNLAPNGSQYLFLCRGVVVLGYSSILKVIMFEWYF